MWDHHDHEGTTVDWEGFEAEIARVDRETEELKRTRNLYVSQPLYRGQRDAGWHLKTTLDRQSPGMTLGKYLTIMERIQRRIEAIPGMKWRNLSEEMSHLRRNGLDDMELFPVEGANTREILQFMVYLRQHGFPSPLLDWTSDPYGAAFFAFSGITPNTQKVAIYLFRERVGLQPEAKTEGEAYAMEIGSNVQNTSERHEKQHARYTWCVKKSMSANCLDYYVFTHHEEVVNLPGFREEGDVCVDTDKAGNRLIAESVVKKYAIPVSERRKAIASLARRNISRCSLFGRSPDDLLEGLWNELVIDSTV